VASFPMSLQHAELAKACVLCWRPQLAKELKGNNPPFSPARPQEPRKSEN
jgi:hypothetical protein